MRVLILVACLFLCVSAETPVYTSDGTAITTGINKNTPPEGGNEKYQAARGRAEAHGGFEVDPPSGGTNCVGFALNGGDGIIDPVGNTEPILSGDNGFTQQPNTSPQIGDVITVGNESGEAVTHVGIVISRDSQTGEIEYVSKTDDLGGVVVDRIKPDPGVHIYRKSSGSAQDDPGIEDARYEYKDAYLKWRGADDKAAALENLRAKTRVLYRKLQAFDKALNSVKPVVSRVPTKTDKPEPPILINPNARPVVVPPTCPPTGH